MAQLRNTDYTDRELLGVIARAAGPDGVATSQDIAEALGLQLNGNGARRKGKAKGTDTTPARRVSTRLAWMKRFGFLETVDPTSLDRGADGPVVYWRVTPIGAQLMGGRLSKSLEGTIENADPGNTLLIMRTLTRRAYGQEVATAVRREYLHNAANRPR